MTQLPHLNGPPPDDWFDPDEIARPVVTVGINTTIAGRFEVEPHRHLKAQFILCMRGIFTCEAEGGLWLVPTQSAVWIPSNMLHSVRAEGVLEGYVAFIDPEVAANFSPCCCTYNVTPLLRELLIRAASFPPLYEDNSFESRSVTLLLEEIASTPVDNFHLPVPTDERLRKIFRSLMDDPADRGTIETWAKRAGLSERTLSRLIAQQVGMSFGRWRQQLNIVLAVQKLSKGASIQQVAGELGYESTSSFVTMFRKALGAPPGRYMDQRQAQ